MIHLRHRDCPAEITHSLRTARENFGSRTAAAWMSGEGPWDHFLKRMSGEDSHYTYYFAGGNYHHSASGHLSFLNSRGLLELKIGISAVLGAHTQRQVAVPRNSAVILRPNGYLMLFSRLVARESLYVSMPDTSGHEALADIESLYREYPGQFRVN